MFIQHAWQVPELLSKSIQYELYDHSSNIERATIPLWHVESHSLWVAERQCTRTHEAKQKSRWCPMDKYLREPSFRHDSPRCWHWPHFARSFQAWAECLTSWIRHTSGNTRTYVRVGPSQPKHISSIGKHETNYFRSWHRKMQPRLGIFVSCAPELGQS